MKILSEKKKMQDLGGVGIFLVEMTEGNDICDKCGQRVPPNNSSRAVDQIVRGGFTGMYRDRHLFPTGSCPGSPSRQKLVAENPRWAEAWANVREFGDD